MLMKEVSRTIEELSAIIARLQFVAAELQKARKLEVAAPKETSTARCGTVGRTIVERVMIKWKVALMSAALAHHSLKIPHAL